MHGDDLLYRFFQDVLPLDDPRYRHVPLLLLQTMAIWFPQSVYVEMPVLLPWVVRDPSCRGNRSKGIPDQWSSPDRDGYLRDDNSLIKALPRSLTVRGPKGAHLEGARMGTEFVASHIWREVRSDRLASRIPLLNSFVPNLVWLPAQVAKLTDREGSVVQQTLQAMAHAIYRNVAVADHLRPVVDNAWGLLPIPVVDVGKVDPASLNWFEASPTFLDTRRARLESVIFALEAINRGESLSRKVVSLRYTELLPTVGAPQRQALLGELRRHSLLPATGT